MRLEYVEREAPALRANVRPTTTQVSPRWRWLWTSSPSTAGEIEPRTRIVPERRPRVVVVRVVTRTDAPTTTIGLAIPGRAAPRARYCVFTGTDRIGNETPPVVLVT